MAGLVVLLKRHWFLIGIAAAVALATCTAEFGRWIDHFEVGIGGTTMQFGASKLAIVGLFFIAGVAISLHHLDRELRNPRLHLFIQGFVYLLTPALVYLTSFWIPDGPMKMGVYLLAALPTTISSCVAFTAAARGNALAAILNSVGSNLLGIVLSPLLVGLMIGRGGGVPPGAVGKLMLEMTLLVFVPFVLGQAAAAHFDEWRERMSGVQSVLSQLLVLLLSYCAFSKSIATLAEQLGVMWQVFAYLAVVQVVLLFLAALLTRGAGLPVPDRAAAIFCSTQKTMAFGLPIAYSLHIEVLPLVFYYLFQMLTASLFLQTWNRRQARRSV